MLTLMHTLETEHQKIKKILSISIISIQSFELQKLIPIWSFKQIFLNNSISQMRHLRSVVQLFDKYIERSDTNI